jgi:hypothetical protein
MNLKTTLVLLVLVAAGAVLFVFGPALSPELGLASKTNSADAGTQQILENELTSAKLHRIEIRSGDREVVLERGEGGEWSLPGKWPVRKNEVDQLVGTLGELRSRFAPIPLEGDPPDLKPYGLEPPAVFVTVVSDNKRYRLSIGEEPGESNRFARPSYLRLGEPQGTGWQDRPEVVRLQPGLVAFLDRPIDSYQQRRLFQVERVVKEPGSTEKVDSPSAKAVAYTLHDAEKKEKDVHIALKHEGNDWQIEAPVADVPDPDKLKSLLGAIADVWAEQFLPRPAAADYAKKLEEYGLKEPAKTLTVTRPSGDRVTLLIGKESRKETRKVAAPPPQGAPFPVPNQRDVTDTYHYAKLQDNDQLFEIKGGESLNDVFVHLDSLRDARLARFKTGDVKSVEIVQGDKDILLEKAKDKDAWRVKKPLDVDAETAKITELLDKLSNLSARDQDVIDKGEAKEYGLDKPAATVTLTVEEAVKDGDQKSTKTRTLKYLLGKHDTDKKKLYVRMDGRPRINVVEDAVETLIDRPALAYRGRGIFDFTPSSVAKIEVQDAKEKYVLTQAGGGWKLAAPVEADAEPQKARLMADDLGRLTAVEYVSEMPSEEDLDKKYGLAKPALSATITFDEKEKKPAKTLVVGKQREGKTDYYAKLADGPAVFAIAKTVHDDLARDSLAYRPRDLWRVPVEDVTAVRVQRGEEPAYTLQHGDAGWKLTGPFDAPVSKMQAESLRNSLASLQCERYEAHTAKELEKFGLDKPMLKLTLIEKGDKPKERTLLIGKFVDKPFGPRFAKLGDGDAVFVIAPNLVTTFDAGALDLLDRSLLTVAGKDVTRIRSTAGGAMTIDRKGDAWQVEAGTVKFSADNATVDTLLSVWSNLRADRFAAYGDKLDLAKYGLDKPGATVTITLKGDKPVEHTLVLGKEVEDEKGARYARLDNGPGVAVLGSLASETLGRTYLDLVDRRLLQLDPAAVTRITRKAGDKELELVKRDDGWHIAKPGEHRADDKTLEKIAEFIARLRAERIAAYPAKDVKEFGLDEPTATVTIKLGEDDKGRTLKIGAPVKGADKDAKPDRYVMVDGSTVVGILSGTEATELLAPPVAFRDHTLAKFADADKAILDRAGRKATFEKIDGTWKLKEPVEAEAEQADLEDFVNAVAKLRADELVAEKPADLKQYGLDKPEARWRFLNGDKEVLALLVGAPEKSKERIEDRCYAKLAKGDLVFLLSPSLTKRALGEYRSRKLWASLDPNQVEKIHFGYATRPFELEKVDDSWQVVGKPELKVKTAAVSEALAALGGLKAERTVADKDPDLKLFGLEPPQLVLEVSLRGGGKRVLQVGRSEGESKRAYARVPGERGDVFTISEADGGRILRNLAAFTENTPKSK